MAKRTITIEDNELLDSPSFDATSISTALINYIQTNSPTFRGDYDAETTRFLTDILAQYGAMMNYKLLGAVMNLYMPTAYTESAIYALGDTLGTDIKGNRPATMVVYLRRTSLLQERVEIPANSSWEVNGIKFFNKKPIAFPVAAQLVSAELTQGELLTYTTTASGKAYEKVYFGADFKTDPDNVIVTVDGAQWSIMSTSFTDYQVNILAEASLGNVVQLKTTAEGESFIKFGSGRFGNIPPAGATITITYNSNDGVNGNLSAPDAKIELKTIIYGQKGDRLQVESYSNTAATGGLDKTSLEAIKIASPGNFAANNRCVRRQDYVSRLISDGGYIDVRVWGEYEEAKRLGYADNSMMNRVFYTGLKSISAPSTIVASSEGISKTDPKEYTTTIDTSTMLPGSFVFTTTNTGMTPYSWSDIDGGYYLFSEETTFSTLNDADTYTLGEAVYTKTRQGDPATTLTKDTGANWTASYEDPIENPETGQHDLYAPSATTPVQLVFQSDVKRNIVGLRFLTNNNTDEDGRAAPKTFALYAYKNGPLPSGYRVPTTLEDETDWVHLTPIKEIGDPGANAYTEWTPTNVSLPDLVDPHNNPEDYQVYAIEIYDRHGNANYTGFQKVQLINREHASFINYDVEPYIKNGVLTGPAVGTVHVHNVEDLTDETTITMTYRDGKITKRQQLIDAELLEKYNHFTTYIQFKQPVANSVNINVSVQANNLVPADTLRANIENAIRSLFVLEYGYLGRTLRVSQLYKRIMDIDGVEYCKINQPYNDVLIQMNEFNVLNNLTIDIATTTKI